MPSIAKGIARPPVGAALPRPQSANACGSRQSRSYKCEVIATGNRAIIFCNKEEPCSQYVQYVHYSRASTSPKLPPIGRLIQPEEVAALVTFLLSPQAAAITGQDIQICGGSSLSR